MRLAIAWTGVAVFGAVAGWADGVSLIVQNDYFTGTDHGYTDGTELTWTWAPAGTNSALIESTAGLRNRMFSPDSIEDHILRPTERPYCATLSAFYRNWRQEGLETVKYEIEAGVLGPHAYGEEIQTWAHRAIHYTIPDGWGHQLGPDEPILNLYMERFHPFAAIDITPRWQVCLEGLYGGALGTTFINGQFGLCGKAGWNVPERTAGRTVLSPTPTGWHAFAFVEPRGRLVLINATLGNSLFHDRDAERRLIPLVGEIEGGITVGRNGLSCTYSAVGSSREYRHQNQKQSYGNICVNYTWTFD